MSKLIIFLFAIFFVINCSPHLKQNTLITVKGKHLAEMGISLVHEHILVDFIGADSTGYHRLEKEKVIERALPFYGKQKKGVNTVFECTPAYLGRDPLLLKTLPEKTGINIFTNTSYYSAGTNKYVPKHAFGKTPEDIAKVWIDEFKKGMEGFRTKL